MQEIVGIGVGISIAIIALSYLIGKLIGEGKYIAFAKNQLAEIVFVAILFFSYSAFNIFVEEIVKSTTPLSYQQCEELKQNPTLDIYVPKNVDCGIGSSLVLVGNLFVEAKYLILQLATIQAGNGVIESLGYEKPPSGGVAIKGKIPGIAASATLISINIKTILNYLFNAVIILFVQREIILFMIFSGPAIFSLGLVLRLFPVLRRVGGLLMAIALSFIVVVPLVYTLFNSLYLAFPETPNAFKEGIRLVRVHINLVEEDLMRDLFDEKNIFEEEEKLRKEIVEGNYEEIVKGNITEIEGVRREVSNRGLKVIIKNVINNVIEAFEVTVDLFGKVLDMIVEGFRFIFKLIKFVIFVEGMFFINTNIIIKNLYLFWTDNLPINNFDIVIEDTANIMLFSYLMTFVVAISTIAFIKEVSPLLGGDIEIAGLTRFI